MSKSDVGGDNMSDRLEIAGLIVQEIIKAKAAIIISTGANTAGKMSLVDQQLSDDAVATTYKKIFAIINNPID